MSFKYEASLQTHLVLHLWLFESIRIFIIIYSSRFVPFICYVFIVCMPNFFNVFYPPFFKNFDKYLHISIFVMCTLIVFELLISVKKIVNSAFKYSSLNYVKKSNLVFQFLMKTNENPIQKGHEFQLLITEK